MFVMYCFAYRGLLDDADFHSAVRKTDDEPIPYMRQYGERPATAPPPSSTPGLPDQMLVLVEDADGEVRFSPRSATPESMAEILGAGAQGDGELDPTPRTPPPQGGSAASV